MAKVTLAGVPGVVFHSLPPALLLIPSESAVATPPYGACIKTSRGKLYCSGAIDAALEPSNPDWMMFVEAAFLLDALTEEEYIAHQRRFTDHRRYVQRATLAGTVIAAIDVLGLKLGKRLQRQLDGELAGVANV